MLWAKAASFTKKTYHICCGLIMLKKKKKLSPVILRSIAKYLRWILQ